MSWQKIAWGLMVLGLWAMVLAGCASSTVVPTPTPIPTPTPAPMLIEGWTGIIEAAAPGSRFVNYFLRDNGERYGITSRDESVERQLQLLCKRNSRVRISGELLSSVADAEGRQIVVTRLEMVSG